jgi:hypothetical protein
VRSTDWLPLLPGLMCSWVPACWGVLFPQWHAPCHPNPSLSAATLSVRRDAGDRLPSTLPMLRQRLVNQQSCSSSISPALELQLLATPGGVAAGMGTASATLSDFMQAGGQLADVFEQVTQTGLLACQPCTMVL